MLPLSLLVCAIGWTQGLLAADIPDLSLLEPGHMPSMWNGASGACSGTGCSLSRRALQDLDGDDDDDDDDGPPAPPNPILAATPVTTTSAVGTGGGVGSTLTVVTNAAELYAALAQGSRHIVIRSHIDLTSQEIDNTVEWSEPLLPEVAAETRTIVVRRFHTTSHLPVLPTDSSYEYP